MSTTASQPEPNAQGATKTRLSEAEAADNELRKTLSRLYREQLRPVGPVEQTLVETIIHNCLQTHRIQQAERDVDLLHHSASLVNLGRLARYRAFLERSTREALAQLAAVQQRRRLAKPAVMTASASASDAAHPAGPQPVPPARSAVHHEPTRLPIPRPIDQPNSPANSAVACSSPPTLDASPQIKPDPQDR